MSEDRTYEETMKGSLAGAMGLSNAEVSKQALLLTAAVMKALQRVYAERARQQMNTGWFVFMLHVAFHVACNSRGQTDTPANVENCFATQCDMF